MAESKQHNVFFLISLKNALDITLENNLLCVLIFRSFYFLNCSKIFNYYSIFAYILLL